MGGQKDAGVKLRGNFGIKGDDGACDRDPLRHLWRDLLRVLVQDSTQVVRLQRRQDPAHVGFTVASATNRGSPIFAFE